MCVRFMPIATKLDSARISVPRSWRTAKVMVALSGMPMDVGLELTTMKRVWLPSKEWMSGARMDRP